MQGSMFDDEPRPERMRPELDELIEAALADAMAEVCVNAGCQCHE